VDECGEVTVGYLVVDLQQFFFLVYHPFRLMVNTVVPEDSWGRDLRVGDAVTVGEVETVEWA
jgi:hypothetical protein